MSLKIAFYGSSLVSALWNGAATYYRGLIRALYKKGHTITFYEPDIYERQSNKDIEPPSWCNVVVYQPNEEDALRVLAKAEEADVIIKASGVGVLDDFLEAAVLQLKKENQVCIFLDVDAPATLDRVNNNYADYFKNLIPKYDIILTYGGGEPVSSAYKKLGAKDCIPIYNALDPDTHFPVPPRQDIICDLGLLANRMPDREKRIEYFFLETAAMMPKKKFLLGGSGWWDKPKSNNIQYIGHVFTKDHNAFNCSSLVVLNISRESMAKYGFSPATRVFEAAGAAACTITDYWEGIDYFFEPDKEILVAKTNTDIVDLLKDMDRIKAKAIGEAAYKRVLAEHTYMHRAAQLENILEEILNRDISKNEKG